MRDTRSDFETKDFYGQVYDILINAGAPEGMREHFLYHFMSDDIPREWRFSGHLGFGGKFWRNDGRIYVNYYPEDKTAKRDRIVEKTNKALNELVEKVT